MEKLITDYFKHTYNVALKMRELAKKTGMADEDVAYLVGYLHDVGKEFRGDRPISEHNVIGGDVMTKVGFNYGWAITAHGDPDSPHRECPLVLLLNYCDLTVDNVGNTVTVGERLQGIIDRYGADSLQAINCKRLIDFMQHGEKDWIAYFDEALYDLYIEKLYLEAGLAIDLETMMEVANDKENN